MTAPDLKDSELTSLIAEEDAVLLLVDHQPQMVFGARSATDPQALINNVVALAKLGKLFEIPTILTSIAAETFGGHLAHQLTDVLPDHDVIDRSFINAWQDGRIRDAVEATGRRKLIIAGLWTEVCLTLPALSAKEQGYDVYAVVDASAGSSQAAHDAAIQRLIMNGVTPVSTAQLLSEFQRDWAREDTYGPVNEIVRDHMGAWGQGVDFVAQFSGQH
ncbi:hydrolase [Corynebacterium bovis]|uniref:Hydrolase n=1 Tax=Corynebacterium bovis TaxID=36808 RepID=A0A426Q3E4_9CORY|nr:hydrolase [Corynebacterium bovis]RRO91589.1 hydrolase [Corynebacterium bovis]RRO97814.1 hydrolase [Corynebacterium bovis]RRO99254.1 hydrolase [Corynebacterium bovis]RRQ00063.1 hydrolase [Corynebacterium bovis]RRQ02915.1 hydrolase [Corynebacterium bovis]